MIHHSCDGCKRLIDRSQALRYVVRMEIYAATESPPAEMLEEVREFLLNGREVEDDVFYAHSGTSSVEHLFKVASGLDSMVLGEPQILGQMKSAFSVAHQAGTTGKILNRLFQHTFSVAKQIRTDTAIGASAVSVAFAAVDSEDVIAVDLSMCPALPVCNLPAAMVFFKILFEYKWKFLFFLRVFRLSKRKK